MQLMGPFSSSSSIDIAKNFLSGVDQNFKRFLLKRFCVSSFSIFWRHLLKISWHETSNRKGTEALPSSSTSVPCGSNLRVIPILKGRSHRRSQYSKLNRTWPALGHLCPGFSSFLFFDKLRFSLCFPIRAIFRSSASFLCPPPAFSTSIRGLLKSFFGNDPSSFSTFLQLFLNLQDEPFSSSLICSLISLCSSFSLWIFSCFSWLSLNSLILNPNILRK